MNKNETEIQLTEERVREIVREEIAAYNAEVLRLVSEAPSEVVASPTHRQPR